MTNGEKEYILDCCIDAYNKALKYQKHNRVMFLILKGEGDGLKRVVVNLLNLHPTTRLYKKYDTIKNLSNKLLDNTLKGD